MSRTPTEEAHDVIWKKKKPDHIIKDEALRKFREQLFQEIDRLVEIEVKAYKSYMQQRLDERDRFVVRMAELKSKTGRNRRKLFNSRQMPNTDNWSYRVK